MAEIGAHHSRAIARDSETANTEAREVAEC